MKTSTHSNNYATLKASIVVLSAIFVFYLLSLIAFDSPSDKQSKITEQHRYNSDYAYSKETINTSNE